ncbi:unnamed protein product, partial [Prorocentrum cordatum]
PGQPSPAASPASGAPPPSASYAVGQAVHVFSRSKGCWMDARVSELLLDGSINIIYRGHDLQGNRLQKLVPAADVKTDVIPAAAAAGTPAAVALAGGQESPAVCSAVAEAMSALTGWVFPQVRAG